MDATLAHRRYQLYPLENHWNSLHFQCTVLMRNSARLRHPGCQSRNLMVIGKSPKPLPTVTFHVPEIAAAGLKNWKRHFRWFVCGLSSAQCMQKSFKNHWETKHFQAPSQEHGTRQGTWASRRSAGQKRLRPGICCWWFHKADPSPCYMGPEGPI